MLFCLCGKMTYNKQHLVKEMPRTLLQQQHASAPCRKLCQKMCNYICLKKETLAVKNMMLWIPFLIFQSVGFFERRMQETCYGSWCHKRQKIEERHPVKVKLLFRTTLRPFWNSKRHIPGLPDSNFCRCVCCAVHISFLKKPSHSHSNFLPSCCRKYITYRVGVHCALHTI